MRAPKRSRSALCIALAGIGVSLGATVCTICILNQRAVCPGERDPWLRDPGAPLLIEGRGTGRAWRFSYSGPDGILGTSDDPVSGGHLRLPAGADVILQLRSDDYIYVFSCPGLKLKEIAVPDLEFSIAFRADRRGEYDLVMDPLCGFRLPPGETMGKLSIASESDFRLWLVDRLPSH